MGPRENVQSLRLTISLTSASFDTSVGRGDFKVAIGTGKVIPGISLGFYNQVSMLM